MSITKELIMSIFNSPAFLRNVLLADAVVSAATGLLLSLGAGILGDFLGLPENFLLYSGLSLLPFALLVAYMASGNTPNTPSRTAVWAIIAYNAMWAVDSILLLLSGWIAPNALGTAFILAQALVVGVLAQLQYFGLRRSVVVYA